MLAVTSTTVTILGGTSQSDYGDPLEGTTLVATGVPASVTEGRENVATESDNQARVIRYYTLRLPYGTAISGGQRIKDERTNIIYVIDNVTTPQHPAIEMDVRCDLRRVT